MKNNNPKTDRGRVEITLPRQYANALLYALDLFETADPDNKLTEYALKLKRKILKYGFAFHHKGEDKAKVYFFQEEAAMLIKVLIFYLIAVMDPKEDFFSLIGAERRTKEKQ